MNVDRVIVSVHLAISIVGSVLAAAALAYAAASVARLRKRHLTETPSAPAPQALADLSRWARRDVQWFVATMVVLVVYCVMAGFVSEPVRLAGYVLVMVTTVAAIAHHFAVRCPHCRRRIGLQSGLGLPLFCDVCRTPLRPDALSLQAIAVGGGVRYASSATLLGLPLVAVAMGADPASGSTRGVARGIIAVGDVAIGGLAVGGIACGGLAVGGIASGLVSIGGLSAGVFALGGLTLGGVAFGGLAVGLYAVGGLAIGLAASGGVALGLGPAAPWPPSMLGR